MSRLRTGHRPGDWADLGASGCNRSARSTIGGAMVVGGNATGPVMGIFGSHKKTPAQIEEARQRFHPHGNGRVA